jgi:hypothetical protein
MQLYVHLDTVLWQAIAFVGVILTFGFGFIADAIHNQVAIPPLDHRATIAAGLFLVGSMVLMAGRSLRRIQTDSRALVSHLAALEGRGWFFGQRRAYASKRWWHSATSVYMVVFSAVGLALVVGAIVTVVGFPADH